MVKFVNCWKHGLLGPVLVGQIGLLNDAAPRILNKSGTLTADIEVPETGAEGMDVCMDVGSPVDSTYKLQFAFTGKIEKVTVELK